ncbi:MAG: 3-oxoacyl-ACP reductase FabG [Planctomycetales bacterium]|nr:3-oxoacyl-ACP reductase FabG [Planctomycetales bacterium]
MIYPGLAGRIALVTGGSRGIGAACCRELAQSGARVALTYRQDRAGAESVVDAIEQSGGNAIAIAADVSDAEAVGHAVAKVRSHWGDIELLVNNAGIFEVVSHEETTLEQWRRMLDVNLTGVYLTTWAVKPAMIASNYGRIVNVASIAGLRARPTCIAYAVSKAGVIALTKSLSEAVAKAGVRVNAVAPGLIDTEMISGFAEEGRQALVDATPIQRLGTPEEIAATVMFLLSDLSSFTTGQTYTVSGGRVLLP